MSRIGRMPIPLPDGVEVTQEGRRIRVKGPLGQLERELHAGDDPRARGRHPAHRAADGRAAPPRAARPDPQPRQQHGHRRDDRLHEEPGDQRRGLSRAAAGHQARPRARLLTSRGGRRARPASSSGSRPRRASACSVPTRSSWARRLPTSARSASRSPTRARASSTPVSRSSARPARPARSEARTDDDEPFPRHTAPQAP